MKAEEIGPVLAHLLLRTWEELTQEAVYCNSVSHLEVLLTSSAMQSFEQLHPRAVSVVIDPIQSVKGKVVIDAFRYLSLSCKE